MEAATQKQFESVRADSWAELETMLTKFLAPSWIFRGHQRADWPLRTSLERYAGAMPRRHAEWKVTEAFKRRAHLYLPAHWMPADDDSIGWRSLMQHHGAPTRLLDWTSSPYVAAFFALEDATEPGVDAAIWAVDRFWCKRQVELFAKKQLNEKAPDLAKAPKALENAVDGLAYLVRTNSQTFDKLIVNDAPELVTFAEPKRDTERLAMQQGLFLCQGNLDKTFLDNLSAVSPQEAPKHVKRIDIAQDVRAEALNALRESWNLTRATLFPGLDGFAQSLRQLLIEPSDAQISRAVMMSLLESSAIYEKLFPPAQPEAAADSSTTGTAVASAVEGLPPDERG